MKLREDNEKRRKMLDAINDFCNKRACTDCPLKKFNDCSWEIQPDSAIAVAYDIVQKNSEARLDGSHLKEQDNKPDMVNHPQHYTQGGIECIDALKAATVGKHGIEAVCVANIIKYLWRYEEKNGVEDVRKARWYLDRLLKELDGQQD